MQFGYGLSSDFIDQKRQTVCEKITASIRHFINDECLSTDHEFQVFLHNKNKIISEIWSRENSFSSSYISKSSYYFLSSSKKMDT